MSKPPIDFTRLDRVMETQRDKAAILALFFHLAQELVAAMKNARRDGEFPQWKNTAHSLRGSAANLGMSGLEAICLRSEKADSLTYDQRSALLAQIKDELERIKAYIIDQNPALLSSGV